MSFNKSEEECEAFKHFGDLLQQLNKEYNAEVPSRTKIKLLVKSLQEAVENA